jgi:hypothetical protein
VVAAVVLPVAPLTALASTTPVRVAPAVALKAPSQQRLAARIATPVVFREGATWALRHFVVQVKPRVVHHPRVRTVSEVHHVVVHHTPVHHTPVHHRPRHIVIPQRFHRFGIATWYSWHPGQCATSYRPHGSRIWIRDLDTGKVISCVVTDTQPYSPNRVVDLSETQFAELAPLGQGIVRVEVTW